MAVKEKEVENRRGSAATITRRASDGKFVAEINGEKREFNISPALLQKMLKTRVIAGNVKVLKKRDASTESELEAKLAGKMIDSLNANSPDIKALAEKFGLKREELGRLTGFSLRALADWNSGKLPSDPARRRLMEVHRMLEALSEIVDAKDIPEWLHKRNKAFDNLTPLQAIELGEMDRIWGMIHEVGSGYLD